MAVDYKLIGARVKSVRKQCGKTQERLAEELYVTVGYISQIERGITKVNLETLSEIAALLNCEVSYLVTGVQINNEQYLNSEIINKIEKLSPKEKQMVNEIVELILKYNNAE